LIPSTFHPTTRRVDDWEQHFVEKSRRRFEIERHGRRRDRAMSMVAVVILTIIFVGAILGLAAWA
jgi:hypothetical protein